MSGARRPGASASVVLRDASSATRAPARGEDFAGAHFFSLHGVRLRGLRFADVGELSALHQDPDLRRVLLEPVPTAFVDIASLIVRANRVYAEQPGLGLWHASDRSGQFLGVVSLLPALSAGAVDLGLRFVPALASRGEAGDAALALCEHAFATLGLLNLSAQLHVDDRPGRHWLEACGFADEGESVRHGASARTFTLDNGTWQRRAVDMFPADPSPPR